MTKLVAIVGAGKMGLWFCNYFSRKNNFEVLLYDKRKIKLDPKKFAGNITVCKSLQPCVSKADIVIVCVPIRITVHVINKCISMMKKGSCIVEISSIKLEIFNSLLNIPDYVIPLSIHPMFGPGAKKLSDTKLLLIPIRNENKEQKLLSSLFKEAKIIVIKDPKSHDSIMAVILGMVYYVNLLLVSTLSNENITQLNRVSGTTFYLQKLLFESILTDNSSLISSLLADNKQLIRYLKKYNEESAKLFDIIIKNKNILGKRINRIKQGYTNKRNIMSSYEKMYSIISNMKDQ
jgi:prephenate dehydrogenase